jgi:hypothetical protein
MYVKMFSEDRIYNDIEQIFQTLVWGVNRNVFAVIVKSNDFSRNNPCPGRKSSQNPIANESKPLTMLDSVSSSKFRLNLTNHLNRTDSLSKGAQ